jgi:hypothetical protein
LIFAGEKYEHFIKNNVGDIILVPKYCFRNFMAASVKFNSSNEKKAIWLDM